MSAKVATTRQSRLSKRRDHLREMTSLKTPNPKSGFLDETDGWATRFFGGHREAARLAFFEQGTAMDIRTIAGAAALAALLLVAPATRAADEMIPVVATPGTARVLLAADCVALVSAAASASVQVAQVASGPAYAVLRAASQPPEQPLVIHTGGKPTDAKGACSNPVQKTFRVTMDNTPQLTEGATMRALAVLMQAFVLALLLEQAFALFFNWRLVQEFLVGRAWRTPIMVVAAYVLVARCNMNLVASLLTVYNPLGEPSGTYDSELTRTVTAMILAGGSVGVNQIMVNLGVRTPVREVAAVPVLDMTEAWVSLQIDNAKPADGDVCVNFDEVAGLTDPEVALVPTIAGVVRRRRVLERLRDVFLPNAARVPRSGGRKVTVGQVYRITIATGSGGQLTVRDLTGAKQTDLAQAPLVRFAPRAVVDLRIALVG